MQQSASHSDANARVETKERFEQLIDEGKHAAFHINWRAGVSDRLHPSCVIENGAVVATELIRGGVLVYEGQSCLSWKYALNDRLEKGAILGLSSKKLKKLMELTKNIYPERVDDVCYFLRRTYGQDVPDFSELDTVQDDARIRLSLKMRACGFVAQCTPSGDALKPEEWRNHLFLSGSGFNHCCFVNNCALLPVARMDKNHGVAECRIVTLRTVKSGEELTISYWPTRDLPKDLFSRRGFVMASYCSFLCACIYCRKQEARDSSKQENTS